MKTLAFIGLLVGVLSACLAGYIMGVVAPHVNLLEHTTDEMGRASWFIWYNRMVDGGIAALFLGCFGMILSVVPAFKIKHPAAWVGLVLSMVAIVAGAVYGTHMFS